MPLDSKLAWAICDGKVRGALTEQSGQDSTGRRGHQNRRPHGGRECEEEEDGEDAGKRDTTTHAMG